MTVSGLAIAVLLSGSPLAPQTDNDKKVDAAKVQAEREAAFAKRYTGTTLLGRFTVDGMEDGDLPKPERYEISSVKKLKNGKWQFTARIKYGKLDVKVPIQLKVLWAGDTPVISEDNFSILGMGGGFGCRVMFHGDRYVGSWQHNKVGGHMYGRIDKSKPEEKKGDSEDAKQ